MEDIFYTLEFDKIKEQLSKHTKSELGELRVKNLTPFYDEDKICKELDITDEALRLYASYKSVDIYNLVDINKHLKRVEIGGILSVEEILEVQHVLLNVARAKAYQRKVSIAGVDNFTYFIDKMEPLKDLRDEIERCIDESGFVKDGASFELRKIRKDIKSKESQIKRKLDQIVASQTSQLSEAIITIRNDRYVLPVKEEYKYSFKGIVHDQSSSGQTVYIEPQQTVDLNNSVSELYIQEKNEITKILMYISSLISSHKDVLVQNLYFLAEVDFMFTKGKYALEMDASKPIINSNKEIKLFQARHPLIPKEEVVANDIVIENNHSTMIITGPNTGGKTVTLKTVGLLTVMAQAGLHIPAKDKSEVAIFNNIYADIGDRQSIELNLSTFSSHMVNIVNIINSIDENSLVLFDELGSGTDPKEGASLAISILEYCQQKNAKTIATTHYSEMKDYAKKNDYILNASVEFNMDKLIPTYKLLLGISGHSNALDISKQLGMNDVIINKAKSILESSMTDSDKLLEVLEKNMIELRQKETEVDELRSEYERMYQDVNQRNNELDSIKADYIRKAKNEANKIVEEAQKEVEQLVKAVKDAKKDHQITEVKKTLEQLKHEELESKKKVTKNIELQPGDEVEVLPYEQKATLSKKVNAKEWEVLLGDMKTKVHIDNLVFYHRPKKKQKTSILQKVDRNVSMKLDLRGMTAAEAVRNLDQYLDKVKLVNYPKVTIVHGHGTGAVRKGVINYLKTRTNYSFRYGAQGEGGTGATIIEFEK